MNAIGRISLVVTLLGCSAPQKQVEAEAAYLGQQLDCVDKYATRPAIDECRKAVRARWGIAETVKDAGGDQ